MSQKNMAYPSEVTHRQSDHNNQVIRIVVGILLAIVVGIFLVFVMAAAFFTVQPVTSRGSSSSGAEAVAYHNALEMQYAQPWLDQQAVEAASAVQFSDALEMQYAQPWLNADFVEAAPDIQYRKALELLYAQPWLDKKQSEDAYIEAANESVWVTIVPFGSANAYSYYTEPYWALAAESAQKSAAVDNYASYTDRYWEMATESDSSEVDNSYFTERYWQLANDN